MEQQQVIDFLLQIRQGAFLNELYEALAVAIEAEQRTGKAAEVTAKLTVSPAVMGDSIPVHVGATVATKLPSVEHGKTIFFATGDGALLSRRDPRQSELFGSLREVTAPAAARPVATDIAIGDRI